MLGLMNAAYRYDVVTVVVPKDEEENPRIELFRDFWTDEKLRKRKWHDMRWD